MEKACRSVIHLDRSRRPLSGRRRLCPSRSHDRGVLDRDLDLVIADEEVAEVVGDGDAVDRELGVAAHEDQVRAGTTTRDCRRTPANPRRLRMDRLADRSITAERPSAYSV